MRGKSLTIGLDRRALLERAAVISSAAALACAGKIAIAKASTSPQEQDAELRQLWRQWLEATAESVEACRASDDARERSKIDRAEIPWCVVAICERCAVPDAELTDAAFHVLQARIVGPDGTQERRYVASDAKSIAEAHTTATGLASADRRAYEESEERRYRKWRLSELLEAADAAWARAHDIMRQISGTAAESLFGVAVKSVVATACHLRDGGAHLSTVYDCCQFSACSDASRLAEGDLIADAVAALTPSNEGGAS